MYQHPRDEFLTVSSAISLPGEYDKDKSYFCNRNIIHCNVSRVLDKGFYSILSKNAKYVSDVSNFCLIEFFLIECFLLSASAHHCASVLLMGLSFLLILVET